MSEKGREALVRLLESRGIDVNHVEHGPIEVEPVGEAFAVHFRGVLFVTPSYFAAAMHESSDSPPSHQLACGICGRSYPHTHPNEQESADG